jgi:hypothetical protein
MMMKGATILVSIASATAFSQTQYPPSISTCLHSRSSGMCSLQVHSFVLLLLPKEFVHKAVTEVMLLR